MAPGEVSHSHYLW